MKLGAERERQKEPRSYAKYMHYYIYIPYVYMVHHLQRRQPFRIVPGPAFHVANGTTRHPLPDAPQWNRISAHSIEIICAPYVHLYYVRTLENVGVVRCRRTLLAQSRASRVLLKFISAIYVSLCVDVHR